MLLQIPPFHFMLCISIIALTTYFCKKRSLEWRRWCGLKRWICVLPWLSTLMVLFSKYVFCYFVQDLFKMDLYSPMYCEWLCTMCVVYLSFESIVKTQYKCIISSLRHRNFTLTLKVLNFWKFTSYCNLKPLWSGMGEVVPARTSPTLHPPSPPAMHQLSRLAHLRVNISFIV